MSVSITSHDAKIDSVRYGFEFESLFFAQVSYLQEVTEKKDENADYEDYDKQIIASFLNNSKPEMKQRVLFMRTNDESYACSKFDTTEQKCNIIDQYSPENALKNWVVGNDISVYSQNGDGKVCYLNDVTNVKSRYDMLKDYNATKMTMTETVYREVNNAERTMDNQYIPIEKIEMTSPILEYSGLDDFQRLLSKFSSQGSEPNKAIIPFNTDYTSNHVHLSFNKDKFLLVNAPNMLKVCMAWWYFEPLFLVLMGHWRRNSKWCVPIRKFFAEEALMSTYDQHNLFKTGECEDYDVNDHTDIAYIFNGGLKKQNRYKALNLVPFFHIETLEVRLKHGSSDPVENKNWLLLLGFFLCAAVNNELICQNISDDNKDMLWNLYNYNALLSGESTSGLLAKKDEGVPVNVSSGVDNGKKGKQSPPVSDIKKPLFHTQTSLSGHDDSVKNEVRDCWSMFKAFLSSGNQDNKAELGAVLKYWDEVMITRGIPIHNTGDQHGGRGSIEKVSIGTKAYNMYIKKGDRFVPLRRKGNKV